MPVSIIIIIQKSILRLLQLQFSIPIPPRKRKSFEEEAKNILRRNQKKRWKAVIVRTKIVAYKEKILPAFFLGALKFKKKECISYSKTKPNIEWLWRKIETEKPKIEKCTTKKYKTWRKIPTRRKTKAKFIPIVLPNWWYYKIIQSTADFQTDINKDTMMYIHYFLCVL